MFNKTHTLKKNDNILIHNLIIKFIFYLDYIIFIYSKDNI